MLVQCRQCSGCLRARASMWGEAAVSEWKRWPRSWFGTLTFAPENRYRFQVLTRARLDVCGIKIEELTPLERFREYARDTGPLVTRYLRRLRKGTKKDGIDRTIFRYLLTVEPHKDWVPHYHLLVHESNPLMPVRKKALDHYWNQGFCQWRLIKDERAAFYAAKYLGKYSMARVRASECYGV